jgi:hypothetical protein
MTSRDEPLVAEVIDEPKESQWTQFANNTWVLLALLFFVTAVLGVPLIFCSTKMTMVQKWLLTIVVTLYTAALFYVTYLILMWAWTRIAGSL